MDAFDQCNSFLITGGQFNPKITSNDNVRDMIIDCRDLMMEQKAEIEQLREALQHIIRWHDQLSPADIAKAKAALEKE